MLQDRKYIHFVYRIVDILLIGFSFYLPYCLRYNRSLIPSNIPYFRDYCLLFLLWVLILIFFLNNYHLYSTDRSLTIPKETWKVIKCVVFSSVLAGLAIFTLKTTFFSRLVFGSIIILLILSLSFWRAIKRILVRRRIAQGYHNINVLIVGAGKAGKMILEEIKKRPYLGFKIVGFLDNRKGNFVDGIPVLGKLSDFIAIAQKHFVDEVIVTTSSEKKEVSELITQAQKMRLGASVVPEHLEGPLPILDVSYVGIIPLLTYKERKPHPSEATFKRLFDLALSLILIILLFPLFIIIAILIKIDSSGPVFFIQKRVGLKGRMFNFYKFRSMLKDADKLKGKLLEKNESKDNVMFKIKKDPRITKVGRFLRKYSLDELPQFFNVLKGNMSLVGPRPPLSKEIEEYDDPYMDRLSIKPGITGLSQIRGRSDLSFSRWVRWDLWYINNWSFGLDIRILLWTIPAVLKCKGAY